MRQSPTYSVGSRFPLANREQVRQYLDPNNYKTGVYKYQFLDLSAPAGISEEELRAFLQNKGIFAGKEKVFINAAAKYNINVIYLVAHACLETGNGTSQFATGIEINGKKVYNMFGISVFDNDEQAGVEFALKNGWTTPEAAIEGGAEFISNDYINNPNYKQNTLYKMRWNPALPGEHQYATDIGWAIKQVNNIKRIYDAFPHATLRYDIPVYRE